MTGERHCGCKTCHDIAGPLTTTPCGPHCTADTTELRAWAPSMTAESAELLFGGTR